MLCGVARLLFTERKPLQPEKALLPMLVTPDGMLTALKLLQPAKALLPMLVTLDGMLTALKLLQP
jgi:hypothetical protein